jgi:peptidoglycan-N-acetylglucosamine deacetylase
LATYLGTTTETLMPPADAYRSAFQWLSFAVVGHGWTFLELAFWIVLGIGSARAVLMLLLVLRRKKHRIIPGSSDQTVTVVIPAYNESAVIERCLDHVLASDHPHFDVIVIDDGSTDGTVEVARKYETDPRVTVLSQANRGKAAALNAALDATESEVLVCIDADSQIHRKALSHLLAHFEDPEVGAVAGRVVVGNRRSFLTGLQALEYITTQSIDRRAKECLNAVPVVPGAIGAWRTNAVLEAGIFSSETLTEDADMTMAIVRSGYRVIYEEQAVATTEAPATLKGLMGQRRRWNLGMMQAGWKHAGAYSEGRALGLFSLTDLFVFGYLMPLLAPLADVFLIVFLVGTAMGLGGYDPSHLLLAYLVLPALDLFSAFIAFKLDPKEDRRLLLLFPLQRILYRPLLYISVYSALWRALSGSLAQWGKVRRVGYQFDHERVA